MPDEKPSDAASELRKLLGVREDNRPQAGALSPMTVDEKVQFELDGLAFETEQLNRLARGGSDISGRDKIKGLIKRMVGR